MTTSLGVKKGKYLDRPSRNTITPNVYELQGNKYKQGNAFPCRNATSIKRVRRKQDKQKDKQPTKHKY